MRPSRLALLHLVFGAWIAVSGLTIAGAVLSFRAAPSAAEARGGDEAPRRARVVALKFNEAMFAGSAKIQLALAGLAVVLAAWPPQPSRPALAMVLGAALAASVLALAVTPPSSAIARERVAALEAGRLEPPDPAQEARFKALHRAHGILDLAKTLLVLGASWSLVRAAGRPESEPGRRAG